MSKKNQEIEELKVLEKLNSDDTLDVYYGMNDELQKFIDKYGEGEGIARYEAKLKAEILG